MLKMKWKQEFFLQITKNLNNIATYEQNNKMWKGCKVRAKRPFIFFQGPLSLQDFFLFQQSVLKSLMITYIYSYVNPN